MKRTKKKIVCFGGGTALPKAVLSALRNNKFIITTITSMVDNGGSSGQLRKEFGVLSPGDIRRHILALSNAPLWKKRLWQMRFGQEKFKGGHVGHNFANVFIGGLEYVLKDYRKVLKIVNEFMEVKDHYAFPATIDKTHLWALLEDNTMVKGEEEIDVPQKHNPNLKIKKIFLKPRARAYLPALRAVKRADVIIIGPGDLYSSVLPCFLPVGMKEAIKKSTAKKVYICNLMTKLGETKGFSVYDFAREVEKYIGCPLNYVLYNIRQVRKERIKKQKKTNPLLLDMVKSDGNLDSSKFIGRDLVIKDGPIVHDEKKVKRILISLI